MDLPADSSRRALAIVTAIALTAVAYFVSFGLHRVWWLVWIAPLPLLLLAPTLRTWQIAAAALVARAIGGLGLWNYGLHVGDFSFLFCLGGVLIPAAAFALAMVLYGEFVRRGRPWLGVLAFPVTLVATEYLLSLWQGGYLSTGYTQLANLPVLQLAALTGLWGISFAANLFPAGVASLFSEPNPFRVRMAVTLLAFYACVLSYGMLRLHASTQGSNEVRVGMVEMHGGKTELTPDEAPTMAVLQKYAAQVQPLAAQGADFVVLPEMSALILDSDSAKVDALFQKTAREAHVQVLLGILHVTAHRNFNEARLYSATGEIETMYRKHHPVPTWESKTTPGTEISILPQPVGTIGVEICRDMDYPDPARYYGQQQVGLVLVPAWDQGLNVDADWHGHLSLVRGVEDGFTMARNAKNGFLTVSDDRGRILAEQPTHRDGAMITMLSTVPVHHVPTLYQRWGDWFAWLSLAALAGLLAAFWGLARA